MTHRLPWLALLVWLMLDWIILDHGIVQSGPNEGKPWILWLNTDTGQQSVEEDPAIYRMWHET